MRSLRAYWLTAVCLGCCAALSGCQLGDRCDCRNRPSKPLAQLGEPALAPVQSGRPPAPSVVSVKPKK